MLRCVTDRDGRQIKGRSGPAPAGRPGQRPGLTGIMIGTHLSPRLFSGKAQTRAGPGPGPAHCLITVTRQPEGQHRLPA